MDCQVHLAEGTIPDFLHELVEVQAGRWKLLVLPHVLAIVLDDLVPLDHDFLVELLMLIGLQVLLLLVDGSRGRT